MRPIFNIKNLTCSYIPNQTVLKIEDLTIYEGKLTFILGVSGVGKSTFIETLGLMNRTIENRPETVLEFMPNGTSLELKDSWNKPNLALATFRNQYFSFIFQNTNLMPNFTAGENMCISQLISGKTIAQARPVVVKTMSDLGLEEIVFDKKIMELSGGQRQRLAFVRAITADFKVLFGDEPTGNLDQQTAFQLMTLLKNHLAAYKRSGIIVSHDIDLAVEFADQLILITPDKQDSFGVIDKEDILLREGTSFKTSAGIMLLKKEMSQFITNRFKGKSNA